MNPAQFLSKTEMISLILYHQSPTKYPTHYFQSVKLIQRKLEQKNISDDDFFYLLGSINQSYISIYKSVTSKPCPIKNSSYVAWHKPYNTLQLFRAISLHGSSWTTISQVLFGSTEMAERVKKAWERLNYKIPILTNDRMRDQNQPDIRALFYRFLDPKSGKRNQMMLKNYTNVELMRTFNDCVANNCFFGNNVVKVFNCILNACKENTPKFFLLIH